MRPLWSIIIPWIVSYALAECPLEELPLPEQYTDGKFYYPNGSPQCVSKGSRLNVSWSSIFEATNLYLIQGGDFNSPVGIALNTASTCQRSRLKGSAARRWIPQRPVLYQFRLGSKSIHYNVPDKYSGKHYGEFLYVLDYITQ
ncbi:TPA_exp: hypothetical protein A8136_4957 [Trichophyton benhamiae CBS 112371]|nr:TPA_exp: hypothetical protein A8136_4957 [Trichophyton benhamiae CBS 112371]